MPPADEPTGLVDLHAHGALGHEFGQDEAGSRAAAAHHRATGTATLIASLVSADNETLRARVARLLPLVADGTIAGIHLEGPYLSAARCGAHDPAVLRDPDPAVIASLVDLCADRGAAGALRQITFAPERPGSDRLIETCARHGILPAIGHTDASADITTRTLARIAEVTGRWPLVTHLFNGMPPFHHRGGGPVAAALASAHRGEAVVELIADGVHVAPEVVRMVFETVGPDHIALVSDAMAAAGLGDGSYSLGSLTVAVDGGVARLARPGGMPGAIAGSTSTLADCVEWAVTVAGVSREDALCASSTTPAQVLGPISRG